MMIDVGKKVGIFKVPPVKVERVEDSTYSGRIVESKSDFESVLALRRDVFREELAKERDAGLYADQDEFDSRCVHLLIVENETGTPVGTYRLNAYDGTVSGFYAAGEFCLEDLPMEMLEQSVELGRACIAREHRNSKVLFLLWRLLANFMTAVDCRYLFGCCSVFTQDPQEAADVLAKLTEDGHVDESVVLRPQPALEIITDDLVGDPSSAEIPPLVNIYMRIGARVWGLPAVDRDLKTVDYFVVFDLDEINRKYRKMFFGV